MCAIIGSNMGISFYFIDFQVLAKGLLSIVVAVVARSRLEAGKQRIEELIRLGAESKDVQRIFTIEALRESLWCLFTLPIVLVIQGVIYRRNI